VRDFTDISSQYLPQKRLLQVSKEEENTSSERKKNWAHSIIERAPGMQTMVVILMPLIFRRIFLYPKRLIPARLIFF
jgi:hypothetical protein